MEGRVLIIQTSSKLSLLAVFFGLKYNPFVKNERTQKRTAVCSSTNKYNMARYNINLTQYKRASHMLQCRCALTDLHTQFKNLFTQQNFMNDLKFRISTFGVSDISVCPENVITLWDILMTRRQPKFYI